MPAAETTLPVTLLTWLTALAPIIVLLLFLVWRRWSTSAAAPLALLTAVLVAIFVFRTSAHTLGVAAGKGIWDAFYVLYVIWPSIILYNVTNKAGAFSALQEGLRDLMPDRLLVVLAYSWVLASFIQSIAGMGTPLAVTIPLMLGLGVRPVYAVLLPLMGGASATVFGSLGAVWFATISVIDLPDPTATLRYATLLVWIPNLTAGITIAWIYGRVWALKRGLPAILVISLIQGGGQVLLVPLAPAIGGFLSMSAALVALFLLNRWGFYRQEDEDEPQDIFTEEGVHLFEEDNVRRAALDARKRHKGGMDDAGMYGKPRSLIIPEGPSISLPLAFAPYAILAVLAVTALLVPPVNQALSQINVGLPFPATETGYGVAQPEYKAFSAFAPLTHPGSLLLISAAAAYILYRQRGLYPEHINLRVIFQATAENALPATTAITGLMLISSVMGHSGEITVLALGIAAIAPDAIFFGVSNLIGVLGTLTTSSATGSNVLFAPLQVTAAAAQNLSVELSIAAQIAGSTIGKVISPGDSLLGATVAGIPARMGEILSKALPWAIVTGLLVAGATMLLYFFVV
jgi:lactate permease